MTSGSHHHRFGPVMWGAIGITFLVLVVVAVHRLDSRIAGYAVGALFLVWLTVCGAAFWLDSPPHDHPPTRRPTPPPVEPLNVEGPIWPRSPSPQSDRDLRPY